MREIKFRAWNKAQQVMCYDNEDESEEFFDGIRMTEIGFINHRLAVPEKEDLEGFIWKFRARYDVMQYTGLRDKNGAEIYEGDILQVSSEYSGSFWPVQVIFEEGAFRTQISHMHNCVPLTESRALTFEIIGNVYENPNLLGSDSE